MCHRVLKEHSADEHKTCDAAHQAEMDATPCEICGKLQKEHSQEQSMECLEKCREQRQRDKKGIEFLRKLSKELPGDDENITEDATVMLVRDRWTHADTQKWGKTDRLVMFAWARRIERKGKPFDEKEAEKEVCLYCNRLVQEHTFYQIQECGSESDGLAFQGCHFEKSEEQQAVSAFMNAQVCECGKKHGEHTWNEFKACMHNQANTPSGILERNLICPGPKGRGFSPEELRAMEHEYVENFRQEGLRSPEIFAAIPGLKNKFCGPLDTGVDLPTREIPPEEIPSMEHGFVETRREWLELSPWLRNEPFTEEEQRELDRVANSCNCQNRMHAHAYDCPVMVGLIALAKKKKPRIVELQKARQAANPCRTCGKLIGQHTYEETLECADKGVREARARDYETLPN
jgi:hypothetical protein